MTEFEPVSPEAEQGLLEGLAKPAKLLMERHLEVAKTWYPHEVIPSHYYNPASEWSPHDYPMEPGVRSALLVNLLTEDNLPYYTHKILKITPSDHPLHPWAHRWTAEERRHSDAIRHWVLATHALDPIVLEDDRMRQMSLGEVPEAKSISDTIAYVSFQELATNIAHRNTGKKLGKLHGGSKVMGFVAGDENLHHEFYSGLVVAALDVDPSTMIPAILRRLTSFKMPGTGIPNFKEHQAAISQEGIFSTQILAQDVFIPTLQKWQPALEKAIDLTPDAEAARTELFAKIAQMKRVIQKMREKQVEKDTTLTTV